MKWIVVLFILVSTPAWAINPATWGKVATISAKASSMDSFFWTEEPVETLALDTSGKNTMIVCGEGEKTCSLTYDEYFALSECRRAEIMAYVGLVANVHQGVFSGSCCRMLGQEKP
jgi:hypothetical protein